MRLFSSVEDVACAVFAVLVWLIVVGFIGDALAVELERFFVVLAVDDAHQAAIDGLFERGHAFHRPGVGKTDDAGYDLAVGLQPIGVATAEGIEDVVHLAVAHLSAQHLFGILMVCW